MTKSVDQWVILQREPDKFVVKKYLIDQEGITPDYSYLYFCKDLVEARSKIPQPCVKIDVRLPQDDQEMVELYV